MNRRDCSSCPRCRRADTDVFYNIVVDIDVVSLVEQHPHVAQTSKVVVGDLQVLGILAMTVSRVIPVVFVTVDAGRRGDIPTGEVDSFTTKVVDVAIKDLEV